MNPQNYTINIRPGWGIPPVVKVSQGDVGRPLAFTITDGQDAITLSSTATVKITGTKPSGLGFTQDCTLSGNTASIDTVATMTQEAGSVPAELIVTDGSTVIGTANFVMYVEPAAHPEGTTDGDAETARDLMTRAQAAVAQAEAEADRAEEAAESASQTGISTAGATAGQVPTANGAGGWSWQDQQGGGGGTSDDITNESNVSGATVTNALDTLSDEIANEQTTRASADESLRKAIDNLVSPSGQSVVVDSSLSIKGAAADAKKTGDELSDIKEELQDLNDSVSGATVPSDVKMALYNLLNSGAFAEEGLTDEIETLRMWATTSTTGIRLSESTLSFDSVTPQTLTVTLIPSDSTDTVIWSSSDTSVAEVANGVVTPVANGTCTITATAGTVSATCTVIVTGVAASYTIINSLNNCVNSNSATRIADGDRYTATISAESGYFLTTVVVTMGGTDITSTAYSNGTINIAEVTGELTVYASAREITIVSPTWERGGLNAMGKKTSYDGNRYANYYTSNYIPMTKNQTLVFYNTNPNWTNKHTYNGTDYIGCGCTFYHVSGTDEGSYIYPSIVYNTEGNYFTFKSDETKAANYSKTVAVRLYSYNMLGFTDTAVVGIVDGV